MKDTLQTKGFEHLINIIESRTKVLDDGVTGIKPIQTTRQEIFYNKSIKLNKLRELVDIS